jgi:hypothetical protein
MLSDEQQIEIDLNDAKKAVKRRDLVKSLQNTKAYKELIEEGYFVQEAARLARAVSNPMLKDDQRQAIMSDMTGIGAFLRYLQTIVVRGNVAESEIERHELALAEARMFGDDEDDAAEGEE